MNRLTLPEMVQRKRHQLQETQAEFGKRFGVTAMAVSLWEKQKRNVPNEVSHFVMDIKLCPTCKGVGYL